MLTIIVLFALAALVGLSLLFKILKGERPPRITVYLHGGLAAVALVLLLLQVMGGSRGLTVALGLFIVAALGGFFLFARDIGGKQIPKPVALIHAGAAVIAFLILLWAYVG